MRVYLFLIIIFLTVFHLEETAAQRPGGNWQGGKMPSIGHIYGKVKDLRTKAPVQFATVTLMAAMKDSVITGALVEGNGDFSLEKVPFGKFRVRVQFIGYKTLFMDVMITPNNIEQDLGDLKLETNTKNLKEVTVETERSQVEMNIDRKVYNVDKDISSRGGTGIDVMKNVPGVSIDATGNVSLRNNTPMIYLDGRPTTLSLDQIPADQIERVEVITNPSAKFDASATGGILNVILKRNNRPGYNGMISAGVGTNNRYNLNTLLNVKEKKVNFFISYNFNTRGSVNDGYTNRNNYYNGNYTGYYDQKNTADVFNMSNFGRIGFDYYLSNRSTITISQNAMLGKFNTKDNQNFQYGNTIRETSYGDRLNDQKNEMHNLTSQIAFRHTFPRPGKELTTDLTYNYYENFNNAEYTTHSYDTLGNLIPGLQNTHGSGYTHAYTYQLDYTVPYKDSSKLEMGAKSSVNNYSSTQNIYNHVDSNNWDVKDPILSASYKVLNVINAAYISYSGRTHWFNYQAGVRFEQTYFTASIPDKNQTFDYYYPDGTKNLGKTFFPSLYLTKRIGKNTDIQFNFSRKTNRAGWRQMMPFYVLIDKQNYQVGNPALGPEFINIIEANFNRMFTNGNFLSSAYTRISENVITNYLYPSKTDSSVLISSFINGNQSVAYGWENTIKYSLFRKKFDVMLDVNLFYTDINATTTAGNIQNQGWSGFGKAMMSYKLPLAFTVQVNGTYEAPKIIPQGKTLEMYFMDFSVNKDLNKFMSFNFTISDVFNTKHFGTTYQSTTFNQDLSRRWESRYFKLGFTWRFGEMDVSLFRKKQRQKDNQNNNQEQDF